MCPFAQRVQRAGHLLLPHRQQQIRLRHQPFGHPQHRLFRPRFARPLAQCIEAVGDALPVQRIEQLRWRRHEIGQLQREELRVIVGRPLAQRVQQHGDLEGVQAPTRRGIVEQPVGDAQDGISAGVASRVLRQSAREHRGLPLTQPMQVPCEQDLPGNPRQRLRARGAIRKLAQLVRQVRVRGNGCTFEPGRVHKVPRAQLGAGANPVAQRRIDPPMSDVAQFRKIVPQQTGVRFGVAVRDQEDQRTAVPIAFGQDVVAGHVEAALGKPDAAHAPEFVLLFIALEAERHGRLTVEAALRVVQRSRQCPVSSRRRRPIPLCRARRRIRGARQVARPGPRPAMPLRFGRSRSIAPSRIDKMDRRPVVVGRIEFHGSCTLCVHCNVVASRSFVRKGTFAGRRRMEIAGSWDALRYVGHGWMGMAHPAMRRARRRCFAVAARAMSTPSGCRRPLTADQ